MVKFVRGLSCWLPSMQAATLAFRMHECLIYVPHNRRLGIIGLIRYWEVLFQRRDLGDLGHVVRYPDGEKALEMRVNNDNGDTRKRTEQWRKSKQHSSGKTDYVFDGLFQSKGLKDSPI